MDERVGEVLGGAARERPRRSTRWSRSRPITARWAASEGCGSRCRSSRAPPGCRCSSAARASPAAGVGERRFAPRSGARRSPIWPACRPAAPNSRAQASLPALAGGRRGRVRWTREYLAEGVTAPAVMLRRGRYKHIRCPGDPDQLYDLAADPHELANLAADPAHAEAYAALRAESDERWDLDDLRERVLRSQARRRLVSAALARVRTRRGITSRMWMPPASGCAGPPRSTRGRACRLFPAACLRSRIRRVRADLRSPGGCHSAVLAVCSGDISGAGRTLPKKGDALSTRMPIQCCSYEEGVSSRCGGENLGRYPR